MILLNSSWSGRIRGHLVHPRTLERVLRSRRPSLLINAWRIMMVLAVFWSCTSSSILVNQDTIPVQNALDHGRRHQCWRFVWRARLPRAGLVPFYYLSERSCTTVRWNETDRLLSVSIKVEACECTSMALELTLHQEDCMVKTGMYCIHLSGRSESQCSSSPVSTFRWKMGIQWGNPSTASHRCSWRAHLGSSVLEWARGRTGGGGFFGKGIHLLNFNCTQQHCWSSSSSFRSWWWRRSNSGYDVVEHPTHGAYWPI